MIHQAHMVLPLPPLHPAFPSSWYFEKGIPEKSSIFQVTLLLDVMDYEEASKMF